MKWSDISLKQQSRCTYVGDECNVILIRFTLLCTLYWVGFNSSCKPLSFPGVCWSPIFRRQLYGVWSSPWLLWPFLTQSFIHYAWTDKDLNYDFYCDFHYQGSSEYWSDFVIAVKMVQFIFMQESDSLWAYYVLHVCVGESKKLRQCDYVNYKRCSL